MTDLELATRFSLAARQLLGAAKKLSNQLPEVSGHREICNARRYIEHYKIRLKELEKEMSAKRDDWPPLPGGR
jgi:hypothetical protein